MPVPMRPTMTVMISSGSTALLSAKKVDELVAEVDDEAMR